MSEARKNPFPGLRPFKFHEHELFFGREEQYEQMVGKLSGTRFLAVVGTSGSGKSSLVRAGLIPALYGGLMMSAGPSWRVALFRPKDDPIRELALALNHRRVFGDRTNENGSSLFRLSEFIDWPGLCSRLDDEARKDGRNPSGRILEVLPKEKRQVIAEAAGNGDIEDKSQVVQTFNEVLKRRDFYQATDFQRVLVTGEAGSLLTRGQNNLTNAEIEKLNRLLLEASYPQEIAKKVEIQTQITEVTLRRGDLGLVEAARQAKMSSEENLLVVVDQFEELFRYARISEHGPHGNQAAAFVKLLLQAKSQIQIPIYVVLTMRSDYLGDCAKFWDLPEAINEGQYLIPRLTRDQRREAIKGPIKLRGADVTPQFVNQLLNDMGDDPDQLPILQHALMRTWDRWEKDHHDNEPIDVRHYVEVGRMAEALSRHADEAYDQLPDDRSREVAAQLFKCLTEKGTGNRESRRPTAMKDLRAVTGAKFREIVSVIDVFREEGRSFLMPSSKKPLRRETSVDISHESLIRNWTKLKKWVDEEAQSANVYRRLVERARLHKLGEAGMLTDLEVEYALKWIERDKPNLAWGSRYHSDLDVMQKSHREAIHEEPARISDQEIFEGAMAFLEQSRKARKQKAQVRRFSAILVAASLVLVVGFWWAVVQVKSITQQNRLKARLAYGAEMNLAQREFEVENFAEVNRLLQDSNNSQEQSGVLNRYEWYRWLRSPNDVLTQDESLRGFEWYHLWQLSHDESSTLGEYGARVISLASPNNSNALFTATGRGTIELRDLSKGLLATLEGNSKDTSSVAFAPNGGRIAIGRRDGSIGLWELSNDLTRTTIRRELASPREGGLPPVRSVSFSPDSQFFAVGTQDGAVRVWVTSEVKELPKVQTGVSNSVSSVAFSPDSQLLAIGQKEVVTLVDVKTWQPILKLNSAAAMLPDPRTFTEAPPINCLAFSKDRKILAMGRSNSSIMLWDLTENRYLVSLVGHSMEVLAVAFSDRGDFASGSRDGGIRLWDVNRFYDPGYRMKVLQKNAEIEQKYDAFLKEKPKPVSRTNLNPRKSAKPSDLRRDAESEVSRELFLRSLRGHAGAVTSLAFLPDRPNHPEHQVLASGSDDKTVKLWALNKPSQASAILGPSSSGGVVSLAFSPKGEMLAAGNYNGSAVLWNTRENLSAGNPGYRIVEPNPGAVSAVAFSPNGQILATASWDKTVTLWQMSSSKAKLRVLNGHSAPVLSVVFLDDRTLVTGSADKTVRLWDVNNGSSSLVTKLDDGEAVLSLAYAPKRRILAIGTTENIVILWDLSRRKQLTKLEGHSAGVSSIAFSPKESLLATGSADTTAKLWDVETGKELATLQGHSKGVLSLSFSYDSKRLATGGEDGSVKLWDTSYEPGEKSTRHALVTLQDARLGPAFAVAFSPNGQILAIGNGDGSVLLRYAATKDSMARQSRPGK